VSRHEPPPEFFIDRSLGRRHLPQALRSCGLVVHTMASVYGEEAAQRLADERWLRDVGAKRWIVLMKDDAIRRRPAERDALVEAGVRAFCLTNAQLRVAEQTERFVSNRHRIIQQARKPGPYIYGVYETGIRRLWP
jgi:PIN like domain